MRQIRLCAAAGFVVFAAAPAMAYENFIPLGTGYSTEVQSVPEFDSTRGRVNQEADIIESEIYRLKRQDVQRDSHINRFFSDPEVRGGDESIDY
jgi:hypothetical protein